MNVELAAELIADNRYIAHKLAILHELGLGDKKQRKASLSGGASSYKGQIFTKFL